MKKRRWLTSITSSLLFALSASGAEEQLGWQLRAQNSDSELEINPNTGEMSAPSGVLLTYKEVVLSADKVSANQETGEVYGQGAVTLKGPGFLWSGEDVYYNFKTGEIRSEVFKAGQSPIFLSGQGLTGQRTDNVYTATNAVITTDNFYQPAHHIRARELIFVPDQYIIAKGATLYLGNTPVFYWPYYKRTLGRHPNNFTFTPGYRSAFGPYLLTTYNWYWDERLDGSIHFDLMQKRGIGFGPDLNYDLGEFGQGHLKSYYIHDADPGLDFNLKPVPDHRERIQFSHEAMLQTNLSFKVVVNQQSDPTVVRDFFESEYRKNVQPNSFLELDRQWPNWSLDLLAQPQINDFYETVERLPDIKLTGLRQQLGISPFYYESESTVGYFRRKFADDILPEYSAARADTYHQILLPNTFFGWLNITPRVGERLTYYSDASGPGKTTTEQTRNVFNTGAEVSFKLARIWKQAQNNLLDVDGLRHILEPSFNYVYVPTPSKTPNQLPQFDYEVPSLRLLPIDFPDYNAIDSIDSENVVRVTLRNKLQTKRKESIENLINWALFTDWRINPRAGQSTFSDFYSDLDFRPRTWITFNSLLRYDIAQGLFKESDHRVVIHPDNVWSVTLGHRYLRDDPLLGVDSGHNLIYSSLYYKLNENWGTRASHFFEARDGVMEEQYYTLYRDLRSWTAALTFRVRENRIGPNDYTIAATFSLKAFPRFGLKSDSDQPSLMVGY